MSSELLQSVFGKGEPSASAAVGNLAKVHTKVAMSHGKNGDTATLNQQMNQVGTGYYRFKVVVARC